MSERYFKKYLSILSIFITYTIQVYFNVLLHCKIVEIRIKR